MPKQIDDAIKERAVRLVTEHRAEYSSLAAACRAVAGHVGVGKQSVRRWVRQTEIDADDADGKTTDELAKIKRLKAENKRLREDVSVLKAATSFFVGELDPRSR